MMAMGGMKRAPPPPPTPPAPHPPPHGAAYHTDQHGMGPRGELRHHAAVARMEVLLAEDRIRQELAGGGSLGARHLGPHHRRRGLVAARFDAENGDPAVHGSIPPHCVHPSILLTKVSAGQQKDRK